MPTCQLEWRGQQAFDALQRDSSVEVSAGNVRLLGRVLLADEMGDCTGRDVEPIGGQVWARKDFVLDGNPGRPLARGARLSVWLRSADAKSTLTAEVNGHPLAISLPSRGSEDEAEAGAYWHRNWPTVEVPAEWLRPGLNSVVLHSDSAAVWETLIDTCRHPNRSAKSRDGGRTWDWGHLGYNDCYDGEYLARLELDRYAPAGQITSAVEDLALREAGLPSPTAYRQVALSCTADTPPGTEILLALRSGPSPAYDPRTWAAWAPADRFSLRDGDRFAQWQATLRTSDPLVTPTLTAVSLSVDRHAAPAGWGSLVSGDSAPIAYPSRPFGYQAPYSRADLLRERWQLDQIVAGAANDWERILRLAVWARDQWTDGWQREWKALRACPPFDAPIILEFGRHNLGVGMCTHYSTVFVHCCAALGITARLVIHRAHCTAEAWSDHWGKWVWLDVGGDVDDARRAVYYVQGDGAPLSALEARTAWLSGNTEGLRLRGRGDPGVAFALVDRLAKLDRFCIVLRNDQLTSPHPGELEHGIVAYHYDGYLWWRDGNTPPLPYFTHSSGRLADLYWEPNRTRIHLQRTARRGSLQVLLETSMPNVAPGTILGPDHHPTAIHLPAPPAGSPAGLQMRLGDGAWQPCADRFEWTLRPGPNRLAARSMNAFGVAGPESVVIVMLSAGQDTGTP
ncbi:MAG: transglutaminase domain-containing protein [Chloroflexi bacterium]|nr:transglutaminase domain-containing protein [Chloroflexota bacterium]